MLELDPEDQKLVTLARSTKARTQAAEGAAMRDTDGRTYAAGTVDLPSFKITALQAAIAAAVSSGAEGIEAAVVVSDVPVLEEASVNAVRDLSGAAPVYLTDPSGTVLQVLK